MHLYPFMKHHISPEYIIIELTERIGNIVLQNLSEILQSIKKYGFKISLDDFGSEYSNLSILSNINFDEVKIDKSLIDDIARNTATSTAIRCISEMCNAFNATEIVIEGVETYDQIVAIQALDCKLPIVQGYYFSKPISTENFVEKYLNK